MRGLGSLARALALAGETGRACQVSVQATELAGRLGDEPVLVHALTTSMWHGTTPDVAAEQLERSRVVSGLARESLDYETLGAAANFSATVSYLAGRPDSVRDAVEDARRAVGATGLPYYRHVTLGRFGPCIDGRESFARRWVPGLLGLYTELGVQAGVHRALRHLMGKDLAARSNEAQWPMELVFLTEAALAVGDAGALRALRPLLGEYAAMNLVCGTMIAVFGSTERYLGQVAACLGEQAEADRCFAAALEMDRRMRSVVHAGETLAHHAVFAAATGRPALARDLAAEARQLAEPISHVRVLRLLGTVARPAGPDGLTGRELEVLRLLAGGLGNQEIGARLHISACTAANPVRSILMTPGAAGRTQAAMYAAAREIV